MVPKLGKTYLLLIELIEVIEMHNLHFVGRHASISIVCFVIISSLFKLRLSVSNASWYLKQRVLSDRLLAVYVGKSIIFN